MPPKRAKATRASNEEASSIHAALPTTTTTAQTIEVPKAHTPEQRSATAMNATHITQAQKQALIDNLQLESTLISTAHKDTRTGTNSANSHGASA